MNCLAIASALPSQLSSASFCANMGAIFLAEPRYATAKLRLRALGRPSTKGFYAPNASLLGALRERI